MLSCSMSQYPKMQRRSWTHSPAGKNQLWAQFVGSCLSPSRQSDGSGVARSGVAGSGVAGFDGNLVDAVAGGAVHLGLIDHAHDACVRA